MSQPIDPARVSRFAARRLAARPALAAELSGAAFSRAEMERALEGAAGEDEAAFRRRLRDLRERVLLREMARDLAGTASLEEVCAAMTDLAETTIAASLAWLGAKDLVVVGMGKLGGRELNVSSDVDLIFLHADAGRAEELERPARRLIRLLADVTEDGFVFRVDMRLRPYGDSGPLVCSYDFLERSGTGEVARHLAQDHALAQLAQPPLERGFVLALRAVQRRVHPGTRKGGAGKLRGERRARRQPTGGEAGNPSGINRLRHCGLECRVGSSFPI